MKARYTLCVALTASAAVLSLVQPAYAGCFINGGGKLICNPSINCGDRDICDPPPTPTPEPSPTTDFYAPVAVLPENVPPEIPPRAVSRSETPECIIYQIRKLPKNNSIWEMGKDYPYYNAWFIWIGTDLTYQTFHDYFEWSAHCYDREAGWTPNWCQHTNGLLKLPDATLSGNYDPCNGCVADECDACLAAVSPMPREWQDPSSGKLYKFMSLGFEDGGRCSSAERDVDDLQDQDSLTTTCTCLESGLIE